jgi:hypothetical protein
LNNQILLQTGNFGLLSFDSYTLLLRNRKPKFKSTIVLTSDQDDGCHYVSHNGEVYKYLDKEMKLVYRESCIKKYKDKVNADS